MRKKKERKSTMIKERRKKRGETWREGGREVKRGRGVGQRGMRTEERAKSGENERGREEGKERRRGK